MKELTWKLVLPLTIISFTVFTKWWYVVVSDGSDEVLTGFPVPYMCPGWHTSMSLQIFVSPLLIDLGTYFAFWWVLVFIISRFVEMNIRKYLVIVMLLGSGLLSAVMILFATNPDNIYTFQRKFEMEVINTGYEFIWQSSGRGDYEQYRPHSKK